MKKYLIAFFLVFGFGMAFSQEDKELDKDVPQEKTDTIDIDDIDFDDIDFDDIEEDELGKESNFPWEKFAVGGQIGNFQFGDQTAVSLAPEIVYNLNNTISFGTDFVYELYKAKRITSYNNGFYNTYDVNYKEENIGARLFTRIKPVQSFPVFAQIEFEKMNLENFYDYYQLGNTVVYPSVDQDVNNVGAGLGFYNGAYYLALMYNFMNSDNKDDFRQLASQDSINEGVRPLTENQIDTRNYPNAISFRAGLNVPLGQGNKNKKRDKNKKKRDKETKESFN